MRKKGPLVSIESYLQDFFQKKGWNSKLQEYKIWSQWEDLVGEKLAQRCQPLKLSYQTLTVSVANSTWLTQLQFMKSNLMDKVQKELRVQLKDIYFKIGPVSYEQKKSIPTQEKSAITDENIKGSQVWKDSQEYVSDPEIKESLLRIFKNKTKQPEEPN